MQLSLVTGTLLVGVGNLRFQKEDQIVFQSLLKVAQKKSIGTDKAYITRNKVKVEKREKGIKFYSEN